LQAGSIPVYMGAPNVDPYWIPGENSVIRTDNFRNPKHLAEYLSYVCKNDDEYNKYFEWKKKGFSEHFKQRLSDCAFYGAECRLCQYIVAQRQKLSQETQEQILQRKEESHHHYFIEFNGVNQYMKVEPDNDLNLDKEFTISVWVKPLQSDLPILDKGTYTLYLRKVWKRLFLELCLKDKCYLGSHPMDPGNWYHVIVTFDYNNGFVRFYGNAKRDESWYSPVEPATPSEKPLYIGTNQDQTEFFHGLIDDLSIWNKALAEKKLISLTYDSMFGTEDNLVAYWGFNQDPGMEIKDITSKHHTQLINQPKWIDGVRRPFVSVSPCH